MGVSDLFMMALKYFELDKHTICDINVLSHTGQLKLLNLLTITVKKALSACFHHENIIIISIS